MSCDETACVACVSRAHHCECGDCGRDDLEHGTCGVVVQWIPGRTDCEDNSTTDDGPYRAKYLIGGRVEHLSPEIRKKHGEVCVY